MAKREYFWGIYKFQSILGASLGRNRSSSATYLSNGHQGREVSAATVSNMIRQRAYSTKNPIGLQLYSSTNSKPCTKLEQSRQPATNYSKQTISNWVRWILGSFLSILIPFVTHKYWKKLRIIEGEAEVVMEEVDNAAKVVEKVATLAEKVSADVADKIPAGHTRLKEIALLIERVSELAVHDAQLTEEFIQKVDALKQDVRDLEKLVQPVVNKIEKQ